MQTPLTAFNMRLHCTLPYEVCSIEFYGAKDTDVNYSLNIFGDFFIFFVFIGAISHCLNNLKKLQLGSIRYFIYEIDIYFD